MLRRKSVWKTLGRCVTSAAIGLSLASEGRSLSLVWDNDSGDCNWNTPLNWKDSAGVYNDQLPVQGDNVIITHQVNLTQGNSAYCHLLAVGAEASYGCIFNIIGGSLTTTSDVTVSMVRSTVNHSAGTLNAGRYLKIGAWQVGYYYLSGDSSVVSVTADMQVGSGVSGYLHQQGGEVRGPFVAVPWSGFGRYSMDSGSLVFTATNGLMIAAYGTGEFLLGNAFGTGTITETAGMPARLRIGWYDGAMGTFRGWSSDGVTNKLTMTGVLTNNGKVIADGYGVERILDLHGFASVDNTRNTAANGWYAQNMGKLILPDVAMASGTASYNFGELSTDAEIDLINSARLTLSGATITASGMARVSILDPMRSDVPEIPAYYIVGIWNVDYTTAQVGSSGTAALTFRYDDQLAESYAASYEDSSLALLQYSPATGRWSDVTGSIDTTNSRVTSNPMNPSAAEGLYALVHGYTKGTEIYFDDGDPVAEHEHLWNYAQNWRSKNAQDGALAGDRCPTMSDTAIISGANTATINKVGAVCRTLKLANYGTSNASLQMSAGSLTVQKGFLIGCVSGAQGTATMSGGMLNILGETSDAAGAGLVVGLSSDLASFTQSDGKVYVAKDAHIGYHSSHSAAYTMSGATSQLTIGGSLGVEGTFTQSAGCVQVGVDSADTARNVRICSDNEDASDVDGQYLMTGADSILSSPNVHVGWIKPTGAYPGEVGCGKLRIQSGTLRMIRGEGHCLYVGACSSNAQAPDANHAADAGLSTLVLGDASTTGRIAEAGTGDATDLKVRSFGDYSDGKITGWGTIGQYGTLTNNGVIEGDGFVATANTAVRPLVMSSFASVTSDVDGGGLSVELDATDNGLPVLAGWYAKRAGGIQLPALAVQADANQAATVTWGEAIGDTDPDLVNSACLAFSGITANGNVSLALVATNCSGIPAIATPWIGPVAVWKVGTAGLPTFSQVAITVRYQHTHSLISPDESKVHLLGYDGTTWTDLTTNLDTANHRVTATASAMPTYLAVVVTN